MTYIDGFVIPVPTKGKDAFVDHATRMDRFFIEYGALRVVEAWADDVPEGKQTDFQRSVQLAEGETVAFAFVEWPDKATRDAAFAKMMENPDLENEPMPFDGKRMIFGGFVPVVDLKKGA